MPRSVAKTALKPRKEPQQARSAETRARILEASRAVFSRYGYAGGTTNKIAEAAGLSVGSLYQYFPNKDAILVELVRAHIIDGTNAILAVLPERIDTLDDFTNALHDVATAMVGVHADDQPLHRVLFEESPRPRALLDELAELEDAFVERLAEHIAVVAPKQSDPAMAARVIAVTVESLVHRFVASGRPVDKKQLVDAITTLVSGYLR